MEIVVVKKFRLIEKSKGKFKVNEHRKLLRSSVKITRDEVSDYNKVAETTGIYWEVDEKATEERNGNKEPKLDREAIKKQADELGIEYQKNIKTDALLKLIEENK
jgi:hypothetical protein